MLSIAAPRRKLTQSVDQLSKDKSGLSLKVVSKFSRLVYRLLTGSAPPYIVSPIPSYKHHAGYVPLLRVRELHLFVPVFDLEVGYA
jgi:hypothetical protein